MRLAVRARVLLAAASSALPVLAAAALPAPLQRFLTDLRTYRADFEQVVQDARGQSIDRGQGSLWVQRPGRFRWDYRPAGSGSPSGAPASAATASSDAAGQLLVTDGRNLWLYERDLQQATVRDAAAAAASAPLQLLSGDVAQLETAFTVTAAKAHDGLQWVDVRPKDAAADFARAELGFNGAVLARMQVSDKLGQQTTLRFSAGQRNPVLKGDVFTFTPPPGVDVIGTPRP